MARAFVRSISFPLSPSRSPSSSKPRAPSSSYHARSVSLPCRSHPILAHLHTHIRSVRAWAQQGPSALAASVATGLAHVDALHAALGDLLDLPEAQDALSGAGGSVDRLLDSFLRLADAHGCFQETVVALKQDVAEALAAVRRRDGARLASAVRAQRRAGKELTRLAAMARECAVRPSRLSILGGGQGSAAEAEVTGLLMESAAATASASAALFGAVAAMSGSVEAESCSCKGTAALVCLVKKNKKKSPATGSGEEGMAVAAVAERLEELEECIEELEAGSEKVFRSLVQTRVALLNIHTLHIF
ncbi:hypothetical protein D1007_08345 [Hordeum vulgare]|uniref:Uncharacterized protein n=1 Tax=Hordeum vulgare subsp. vulgare TaxID=112509 RepID=A0A8I6YK75_HORVV|nr:uncharacterized protein LOC123411698 [Hordeum vulgare subsp. vulgare]KAE8814281.1 hypothetical protein D1007_08345 [Hordeum vulgare]